MAREPKPFQVKPWKPGDERQPRTKAQHDATMRNFRIAHLRSLWTLACQVKTPWRRKLIRWLLDGELASRGAERHGVRVRRRDAERDARWARLDAERNARKGDYDLSDIPF